MSKSLAYYLNLPSEAAFRLQELLDSLTEEDQANVIQYLSVKLGEYLLVTNEMRDVSAAFLAEKGEG